ncbi:hypothetical protein EMCRGX_G012036 [Ephydatia muelleri]|eukprot:Em0006g469a
MSHDHHAPAGAAPTGNENAVGPTEAHIQQMSFYAGHILQLLFPSWSITSAGGIVGAFVALFVCSFSTESLKFLQRHLSNLTTKSISSQSPPAAIKWNELCHWCSRKSLSLHLVQSALQVVQVGAAYLLMLAVSSYNVWIFLAVVLGLGTGYLAFGWTRYLQGGAPKEVGHQESMEQDEIAMLPKDEEDQK